MIDVLLQLDPGDGNELIEAEVSVAAIPRKGDMIEVWDAGDGGLQYQGRGRTPEDLKPSGLPKWLTVASGPCFCAYAPERITLAVVVEGCYDLDEARRIMEAADKPETP